MDGHGSRCALITGVGGQDGVYLARLLGFDGVRVVGTVRPGTSSSARCRAYLGHVELVEHDVRDSRGWEPLLDRYQPDEIYHLAAMSSLGRSWEVPDLAAEVNADGRRWPARSRHGTIATAQGTTCASSMHRRPQCSMSMEEAPMRARSGMAQHLVVEYRERHGLRASLRHLVQP